MDPALIPSTAAGRQLAWLMSLEAEPSTEEIEDHLEPTAAGEVHVDLPERTTDNPGLAWGLLAFGTMVRELPGVVIASDDVLVRLELQQGCRTLCGLVLVGHGCSGKIALFGLTNRPAESEREVDRIRLLYDRVAGTYEELSSDQAPYWDHARAWVAQACCDGCTVLDVGCGPGHLTAGLPLSVRIIGCDLSPAMVRRAALARPTGRFVVHDFHQPLPAQWPLADVTVALGCLEFCADLARVARNLVAATKPEGQLLLTLPRAQRASPQREITLRPFPFSEIIVRLRQDAEVEAVLGAAGLEVIAHEVGPGWTVPGIGSVEYGYWELKAASVDVEVPPSHSWQTGI
jgi:malonyl-CoA O-methyltransferase